MKQKPTPRRRTMLGIWIVVLTVLLAVGMRSQGYALSWDGSSTGGGGATSPSSPGGYAVRYSNAEDCVVGYRFSVINNSGAIKGYVIDVYRGSGGFNNPKFSSKYNKADLIRMQNNSWSTTTTTYQCMQQSQLGISLPFPSGMGAWQASNDNLNAVLRFIQPGLSINALTYGDKVLVEPIVEVRLEGSYHSLTVTELALYGKHILGVYSNGGASSNSGSWGFIALYTNKNFPNLLRAASGYGIWTGVSSALTRQATFYDIINSGYGVGVAYAQTQGQATVTVIHYGPDGKEFDRSNVDTHIGASFTPQRSNNAPGGYSTNGYSYYYYDGDYHQIGEGTVGESSFTVTHDWTVVNVDYVEFASITVVHYGPDGREFDRSNVDTHIGASFTPQRSSNAPGGYSTNGYSYYYYDGDYHQIGEGTVGESSFTVTHDWMVVNVNYVEFASITVVHYGPDGKEFDRSNVDTHIGASFTPQRSSNAPGEYSTNGYSYYYYDGDYHQIGEGTVGESSFTVTHSWTVVNVNYTMQNPVTQGNFTMHPTLGSNNFKITVERVWYGEEYVPENVTPPEGYHPQNYYEYYTQDYTYLGEGVTGVDGISVTQPIIVHAFYDPNTYTIQFDGNGATGGSTASMSMIYDEAKALTANGFVRIGYTFTGWNTRADGTGTWYSDGQSVRNLTSVNGGIVTLYAQWQESLKVEPVSPNAAYREGTEVITSYWLINDSDRDFTPDDNVTLRFDVTDQDGGHHQTITKDQVVVPADERNLVYIRWTVPTDLHGEKMNIRVTLVQHGEEEVVATRLYTTSAYTICQTEDTSFAYAAPEGLYGTALPTQGATVTWNEFVYEDGGFVEKTYQLRLLAREFDLVPQSASAVERGGTWSMKSGYGFSCSARPVEVAAATTGRVTPTSEMYTMPQYSYVLYPEYRYAYGEGLCTTLTHTEMPTFPEFLDYGMLHFTPIWYPDGDYTVSVVSSDCWTPAGMVKTVTTQSLQIQGSMFDDWYVGRNVR